MLRVAEEIMYFFFFLLQEKVSRMETSWNRDLIVPKARLFKSSKGHLPCLWIE